MTWSSRFLFGALLVVETTWWYTIAALGGALLGLGGSPLNGVSVLLVLLVASLVSLYFQNPRLDIFLAQGVSLGIALVTIYLAIAISVEAPVAPAFHPLWLLDTLAGISAYSEVGRQFLGGFLGIALWWRGMEIASSTSIESLLFRSFRIGLAFVTVGALVDALAPLSFGMAWIAFAFFLAGLSALMLNQLQREGVGATPGRRWLQISLGTIGAVVITGLLLSLAAGGAPAAAAAGLFGAVGFLLRGIILLIAIPMAYVTDYLMRGVAWIVQRVFGEGTALPGGGIFEFLREVEERREAQEPFHFPELLSTLLQWGIIIYVVMAGLLLLYLAFVRRGRRAEGQVVRASTWGETPLWEDLASLFKKLLPHGREQNLQPGLPTPQGDDPRSGVLRLYYTVLLHAHRSGMARKPSQTPLEYHRSALMRFLPTEVSRRLTDAFNRVWYGGRHPDASEVQEMEAEVQGALEGMSQQRR